MHPVAVADFPQHPRSRPGPVRGDIRIKRAYEAAAADDGVRVLVDRLWPRGLRKTDVAADLWLKDAAPSAALREWFGHAPERWDEFREKYRTELAARPGVVAQLLALARHGRLTLVYGARDEAHNQAVVLRSVLVQRLPPVPRSSRLAVSRSRRRGVTPT